MKRTSYFDNPVTSLLMQNVHHDCRTFGACLPLVSYPSNRGGFYSRINHFGSTQKLIQFYQRNKHDYVCSSSRSVTHGNYSILQSSALQHWFKNWQEQRKNKLTASTFSIAIGFWPRRRVQLWLEKIGAIEPFTGNLATCWNNIKEEEALESSYHSETEVNIPAIYQTSCTLELPKIRWDHNLALCYAFVDVNLGRSYGGKMEKILVLHAAARR